MFCGTISQFLNLPQRGSVIFPIPTNLLEATNEG